MDACKHSSTLSEAVSRCNTAAPGSLFPFGLLYVNLSGERKKEDGGCSRESVQWRWRGKEGGAQLMRRLLTGSPCFEISPHCSFVPQGGCTTSMVERAFSYRGDQGMKRKEERRGWGGNLTMCPGTQKRREKRTQEEWCHRKRSQSF